MLRAPDRTSSSQITAPVRHPTEPWVWRDASHDDVVRDPRAAGR
jgi:hypothetical protein